MEEMTKTEEQMQTMHVNLSANFFKRAGRMAILLLVPVVVLAGFLYIFLFDPEKNGALFMPCPIHAVTGFYCPADGNTRALRALVYLDIPKMLRNNLLFPFFFLLLAWLLVGEYLHLLMKRRVLWLPKQIKLRWIWMMIAVTVLFTVLRNIPVHPFQLLAPGS